MSDSSLQTTNQAEYTSNIAGQQGCSKGTRNAILKKLSSWSEDRVPIYWMNGMAGTGKTTIAYTFCQQLRERLIANFFCSRTSDEVADANRIIPTLASQIAHRSHEFATALYTSLKNPINEGNTPLESQFHRLLLIPATAAAASLVNKPIIVWDGADECRNLRDV
jgi:hypothetical protein